MIVEPVSKADIQKAVLVDTALEEVNLGASSKTVETSADAIEICKSVDEKVQVESPSKDMIRREVSMEEESPKEPTREEEAPIDAICTEETVQKENVKHEKLSVMFDSKNELDTDPLSNDKLPGDSHTKVDTLVENKKVEQKSISDEEEHQEMPNKDAESSETPILERPQIWFYGGELTDARHSLNLCIQGKHCQKNRIQGNHYQEEPVRKENISRETACKENIARGMFIGNISRNAIYSSRYGGVV